ncbi:hypothetical protein ACQ4LE_005980 [Meloidogyne hapla]|uniref:Secreted protein n=1 Tax=Meloidogyne hapla TaxID=6305 RepID=A0A1I8AXU2_MELHA
MLSKPLKVLIFMIVLNELVDNVDAMFSRWNKKGKVVEGEGASNPIEAHLLTRSKSEIVQMPQGSPRGKVVERATSYESMSPQMPPVLERYPSEHGNTCMSCIYSAVDGCADCLQMREPKDVRNREKIEKIRKPRGEGN